MDERKLTWSSTDVVESELRDAWVELEEEGEWLSDTTSGTENGDLGELYGIVRIASEYMSKSLRSVPRRNESWIELREGYLHHERRKRKRGAGKRWQHGEERTS